MPANNTQPELVLSCCLRCGKIVANSLSARITGGLEIRTCKCGGQLVANPRSTEVQHVS